MIQICVINTIYKKTLQTQRGLFRDTGDKTGRKFTEYANASSTGGK